MRKTDTHLYFWDTIYSQWHESAFTEDGITYCNAEQYMMAKKAEVFNDLDIKAQILSNTSPRAIKKLGRQIKNFSDEKWNKHKIQVVAQASYLKFTQNKDLKEQMIKDKDLILVEASPRDKIWGIGLAAEDDRVLDESQWQGQNLLGICLMMAREKIIEENEG